MRAAQMKERPGFALMKQGDVQTIYHMQMPRWLFSDPRYADMSLDAKVTYTFLLNRFQLSRRNGWVNDFGEVFVIFPRKELARELRICEQRVTAAFKKLVELKLVWEKRCGRGDANQVYLASVEPVDNPSYASAPFVPEPDGDSKTAESEGLGGTGFPMPEQEPQDLSGKNLQNRDSRDAGSAVAEPQKQRPSYITLVCHVTADGSSDALKAHSLWHLTMMEGTPLPDCGLYFMEQKCAVINPGLEKAVAARPGDYALCAVTLEMMGVQNG